MTRFQYTYQKIVDLKSSEKTQAEWLLSAAVGKLQAEETTLENLQEDRGAWCCRLLEAAATAVPLSELVAMQQYVGHIDICIGRKLGEVKLAQRQVDESRAILSDRMKDEKVWQKSKEQALGRFRSFMQTKEQSELDEMATVRFMIPTP